MESTSVYEYAMQIWLFLLQFNPRYQLKITVLDGNQSDIFTILAKHVHRNTDKYVTSLGRWLGVSNQQVTVVHLLKMKDMELHDCRRLKWVVIFECCIE